MSNYPGRRRLMHGKVRCTQTVSTQSRWRVNCSSGVWLGAATHSPLGGLCREQRILGKQTDPQSPASIKKMTSSKWERVGANKHLHTNKLMHMLYNYRLCTCKYTKYMQLKTNKYAWKHCVRNTRTSIWFHVNNTCFPAQIIVFSVLNYMQMPTHVHGCTQHVKQCKPGGVSGELPPLMTVSSLPFTALMMMLLPPTL